MEFNLERYRKNTIVKLIVMTLALSAPIIIVFTSLFQKINDNLNYDINISRWFVVALVELSILFKLYRYIRILSDEKYAKKIYTYLNDERNTFLKQKTQSFTFKLSLYLISIAAIIVAIFNKSEIFYTLLITIAGLALIYLLTYIYYVKKY
jgi:hypothetical protein